jgi:hypothetical protein
LALEEELSTLDACLMACQASMPRRLRERFGVGPQTAAVLVAVAGDNPERLKSEAALAAFVAQVLCRHLSGKTVRHRLNRGGDRSANNALWTIAMVRMRSDPRTRAYVERRTKEGMSKKEIHRCLKRYIVRECIHSSWPVWPIRRAPLDIGASMRRRKPVGIAQGCTPARQALRHAEQEAMDEVIDWLRFYNHRRLHSTLGYLSPDAISSGPGPPLSTSGAA